MEVITDADGQSAYYLLQEADGDLESVEDAGIESFDVSCEGGEDDLRALVGCLAAQLGLSGRFLFSRATDRTGKGVGFELLKVGEVAKARILRGEFPALPEGHLDHPQAS